MASNSLAVRLLPEPERFLTSAAIGAGFLVVGSPLQHPAVLVRFYNQTDAALSFSFDGINSALSLAPQTAFDLNVQSNKGVSESLMIAMGTQFYVKQATAPAPTTGFAFISVFYAATNQGV